MFQFYIFLLWFGIFTFEVIFELYILKTCEIV